MKRRFFSIAFILFFAVSSFSQIPDGYYSTATGKTGKELKTALYNIIKAHTERSYSDLWTDFQTTDKRSDGKVWDMYSDIEFTFGNNQCGNYSAEGDCYNREHSFPKSWFNDATPMYTDLFHLYPTDGYVNNRRSNYPFGEVSSPTYTSGNGGKLGSCSFSGYTGIVFEPVDQYKGDFARTYLYMATCYEDKIAGWVSNTTETQAILAGNSYPAYKTWYVQLLLKWNKQDPVSQKEIDRNNAVFAIQHNRNPYIDHQEYVEAIWGTGTIVETENNTPIISVYPNPADKEVFVEALNSKAERLQIVNLIGTVVYDKTYSGEKERIDVSELKSGFYFVHIVGKKFKSTTRIVIY